MADTVADVGIMRERIDDLTAQLAASPASVESDASAVFTDRELKVIALLAMHLTTQEIGDELFLSRNTIKTYLRRVYRKLNASSREEAVLVADELGLLAKRTNSGRHGVPRPTDASPV